MSHEDLVALALQALPAEEADRLRALVADDPAAAAELAEIEKHLAIHEQVPQLRPAPALWRGLEERLVEPAAPSPSFPRRYWMPLAAAALVLAAFFLPRFGSGAFARAVHGDVARTARDTYTCKRVSRIEIGDGVLVTMDTGTILELFDPERLALRAGRVFLTVPQERRGFRITAGKVEVETTGTAFGVWFEEDAVLVGVEEGSVRCTYSGTVRDVAAGRTLRFAPAGITDTEAGGLRDWFTRPTLVQANLLDASTISVVISNEMPDTIELAPPTSGAPFFVASFEKHNFPLTPAEPDRVVALRPGRTHTFQLRLPRPLPEGEPLIVTYLQTGARVEASR